MIKHINKHLLLMIVIMISFSCTALAQGPEGNGGDPPANDVPIDGGLSLLLAAGAGYVGKKAYDAKKKKAQKDKEILP